MEFKNEIFFLINIYAPNKVGEKKLFFAEVAAMFETVGIDPSDNIICGGDWNCIFDVTIDKAGGKNIHAGIVAEMKSFMEKLELIDVWRIRNPDKKRFTFRQKTPLIQSRLDYFLISNGVQDLTSETDIAASVSSDHSCIIIKLNVLQNEKKGKGYWKFNSQHLKDEEFVAGISELITNCMKDYDAIIDRRVSWELIKYEIRKYCIKYGAKKRKEMNVNTGNLLKQLNDLEDKLGTSPTLVNKEAYETVKDQLNEIEMERSRGAILRSKAQWIEEGEKPTRYLFNLEKRNYIKKHIRRLKLPDGTIINDPEEILQTQKSFYEALYTSKIYDNVNEIAYFMGSNVPTLNEDLKNSCEGMVTADECFKVLKLF